MTISVTMGDPLTYAVLPFPIPVGMKQLIKQFGDNKVTLLSKGNCMGNPQWEAENLVILRNVCGTKCSIQLHRKVADHFEKSLGEAIDAVPSYRIRMLGGYCARHQRNDPTLPLSVHSYGAAFDINWDNNPMAKKLITDLPTKFIEAFERNGWEWGGRWKSIKDSMHFQFAKEV